MTATALSGSSPAAGAQVTFNMIQAGGGVVSKNVTTDSTGKALFSYRLGPKDPKGTYSVTATITYNGSRVTTNTGYFQVQ